MIQGAGSNVGKSLLVAGLARAALHRGLSVTPFKPQNMSNNAAVTADGGEIGRAQALQARASGRAPLVDMNPVLLKPETDTGAQVIVQGQRFATVKARDYGRLKPDLLPRVMESFARLGENAELILVEGAGSPAEVNLRRGDIANMGFAEAADIPVVLAGDIDRGGVIAQLVGTHAVLPPGDRDRIEAFIINKFRGDVTLFDEGLTEITRHTGWRSGGVLPFFAEAWKLPAEDIMDLRGAARDGGYRIVVPRLGRIANFDDLDPLAAEPGVSLEIIEPGRALPGDADLVLLPGSKATLADLADLRAQGWDVDLMAHVRRGGHVLGICGGYQMLGRVVRDPHGVEGGGSAMGLGLLEVTTTLAPAKTLALTQAVHRGSGAAVEGYEIHMGQTAGPDCGRGWLTVEGRIEGAANASGRVMGTYLHGIFTADDFRRAFLGGLGAKASDLAYDAGVEATLDALAAHIEAHLDVEMILGLAR